MDEVCVPVGNRLPRVCGRPYCYCNGNSTLPNFPKKIGHLASEAPRDPRSVLSWGKVCRRIGRYCDHAAEYFYVKELCSAAVCDDTRAGELRKARGGRGRRSGLPRCASPRPAPRL